VANVIPLTFGLVHGPVMTNVGSFQPHLEILPAAQRRLWDELGVVPESFALYEGTALALRLGHRQSIDFDFFSEEQFQPAALTSEVLLAGGTITQQAPNTLSVLVDHDGPVKLSFFGVPGVARLRPPDRAGSNGLRVASLLDLAGTKASVVQQRAEAKDYLDIEAILSDGQVDLPSALGAAQAIYGAKFNPLVTLKALSFFDDGDLHRLTQPTRDRLVAAVRRVEPERLPTFTAMPLGSAR
jgi:hypothetical protein